MIRFISFGTEFNWKATKKRLYREAHASKFFDSVGVSSEKFLDAETLHYCVDNRRGFGFWCWKPLLVSEHLKTLQDNDIIVYADIGCTINKLGEKRYREYIDLLRNGEEAILFGSPHKEKTWSKMDLIDHLDAHDLKNTGQIMATAFLIKKTENTVKFVDEWKDICFNNRNLLDDSESILPNDKTFQEHRHDQSIFSILAKKKYNFHVLSDETHLLETVAGSKRNLKFPIWATRRKY